MVWNKLKKHLEEFLAPALVGKIEYEKSGYRYRKDKKAQCYITVDKKKILKLDDADCEIRYYNTEQEIKEDLEKTIRVTEEDIENTRKTAGDKVPEERLAIIAKGHKINKYSKQILSSQMQLTKVDFQIVANDYLSESVDNCLNSEDIIMNILAIIDRRVGKKRLQGLEDKMNLKHPAVRYFYELRTMS